MRDVHFFCPFIQQVFIEHLQWAGLLTKYFDKSKDESSKSCLQGTEQTSVEPVLSAELALRLALSKQMKNVP